MNASADDRKRTLIIQVGLTAAVVVVAVVLVICIVMSSGDKKPAAAADHAKSIRVTSSSLITKEGSTEPKVVVSLYEDFLCPHCASFEQEFGPTVNELIDAGTVAVDYYMVAILDRPQNQNYSSRAGSAAYCVADTSTDAFRRFHGALYARQPSENSPTFPTDTQLAETARQAGADVADCVNGDDYSQMVKNLADATGITSTPTVRINGQDYQFTTPEALASNAKEIAGQ
ncbi:DsbA family protein [Mycolicibacterium stellerae]|uniref:DsbA family protein n=1 Tax=Mycolicibacterium stellerae TaxID=2358193 RepID=UPI002E10D6FE